MSVNNDGLQIVRLPDGRITYIGTIEALSDADILDSDEFAAMVERLRKGMKLDIPIGVCAERRAQIFPDMSPEGIKGHRFVLRMPETSAPEKDRDADNARIWALNAQLRRRYPKLRARAWIQELGGDPKRVAQTIHWSGRREDLIEAGLWREDAKGWRWPRDEFGDTWICTEGDGAGSYVICHRDVHEPEVPGRMDRRRRWPSKKVEQTVSRIWKRIATTAD